MPDDLQRDGQPAVEVRQATFNYGRREILKDISLQIPVGQVFGILGASGSGKTTLIPS